MNKKSIISLLLNDKNVNLYTKILIFIFYKNKSNNCKISDNDIIKYLKLNKNDKKKIYRVLKEMENNKIIKINLINQRRTFTWLVEEEEEKKKIIEIPEIDWLNNDF